MESGMSDEREELDLEGDLDAHEAEALRLEIKRLARRYGVEIESLEIRRRPDGPSSA
jgi:hypothetical protein